MASHNNNTRCSILSLLRFTDDQSSSDNEKLHEELAKDAYSYMAAAQLAKEHFNSRNPAIVSQLATLTKGCPVQLNDFWYVDSKNDDMTSLSALLDIPSSDLCAVIGPNNERALQVTSGFTQLYKIPQITTLASSSRLNFESVVSSRYPLYHYARAMADYLLWLDPPRDYAVTFYDNEDFDGAMQERGEEELDMKISGEWVVGEEDAIEDAIEEVLEEGANTVVINIKSIELLYEIADYASEYGLLIPNRLWVITGSALSLTTLETMEFEVDSNMDKLLRGAALYVDYDPFMLEQDRDKFLESWKQQNTSLVQKLNSLHPLNETGAGSSFFAGDPDYFQTVDPSAYSSFYYDSVMLVGLAKCQLEASSSSTNHSLLDEMLHTQFDGASGSFQFEQDAKIRSLNGTQFAVLNIRNEPKDNGSNRYIAVPTAVFKDGEWSHVEGQEFIYNDGTTNSPLPIRTAADYNYLDESASIVGLCLMSVAVAIAVATCIWVFVKRNKRIVAASQPEFLYALCSGAALVAASISFASFDDGMGYSQERLSAFCMAGPWFFVIGYIIIYCALVGKLWRINKLMSSPLQRQKVTIYQGLWPFAILLGCIIALTCWQVIDPLVWTRVETNDDPLKTAGRCLSENSSTPYVATLGALIGIATCLTLIMSWKAKNVQAELSESKWIFAGVFSHIQLWAVGLPVFVLMNDDSATASYMIRAALAFLFSTVMVILVIWPKIVSLHFPKLDDSAKASLKVNISDSSNHNSRTRVSGIVLDRASSLPLPTDGLLRGSTGENNKNVSQISENEEKNHTEKLSSGGDISVADVEQP